MSSVDQKRIDNLLTLYLREASMLQPTFKISNDHTSTEGILIDVQELNSGRTSSVEKIVIQINDPTTFNSSVDQTCEIEFTLSSSGLIKFQAKAKYKDGIIPILEFHSIENTLIQEQRASRRTQINTSKKSFVSIETQKFVKFGSFKLTNISKNSLAGTLHLNGTLNEDEEQFLSGKLALDNGFITIKRNKIIRLNKLHSSLPSEISIYQVVISFEFKTITEQTDTERRQSKRVGNEKGAIINLKSDLLGGEIFNAQIIDISAGGFSAKLINEENETLVLPGLNITFAFTVLHGQIIDNDRETGIFRVKWNFEDLNDKVTWSKYISSLLQENVVIGSYENESILTLLARSGIKNSSYLKNFHTLTSLVTDAGTIDPKGALVTYRWINKDKSKKIIAHVGAFKIADNLWFMGDLFASLETEKGETKKFVEDYLDEFINFAHYVCPYPRILTAWKPNHPYWKKLEDNLKLEENGNVIFCESSALTFTPNLNEDQKIDTQIKEKEILPSNLEDITKICKAAEKLNLGGFLSSFNFSVDSFASPHLKMILRTQGYAFFRQYYLVNINNSSYLSIISNLPEGLSPQRHQSAVWLISLTETQNENDIELAIKYATTKATNTATFPSIIRFLGAGIDNIFKEKLTKVVIADPKIWRLA